MSQQSSMDAKTRAVFRDWLKENFARTVRADARQTFAPLPAGTDAWPIDDKVYDQFLNLVFSRSAFLGKIRKVTGLDRLQGNILRFGLGQHILKRTNVATDVKRAPTITGSSTPELFNLLRIEYDVLLDYDHMRHWAHKGVGFLQQMVSEQVTTSYANDLQWVGFRGTSDGNPPVDAALADLAIGWLQLLRDYAAGAQFMSEVVAGSGIITVGPQRVLVFEGAAADKGGGKVGFPVTAHGRPAGSQVVINGTVNYDGAYLVDATSTANEIVVTAAYLAEDVTGKTATHTPDYKSLDSIAADLRNGIDEELRMNLQVLVSEDLRASDEEAIYGEIGRTPTEKVAAARAMMQLAGMDRDSPYGMPGGSMVITDPANLAVYFHQEAHRRVEDTPENNGVTLWNDTNIDYIVQDYRRIFAAENIAVTL